MTEAETLGRGPGLMFIYIQNMYPVLSQTFVTAEIEQLRSLGFDVRVYSCRKSAYVAGPVEPVVGSAWRTVSAHFWWLRRSPRKYLAFLAESVRARSNAFPWNFYAPLIAQQLSRERAHTHLHTHFATRAASLGRAVQVLSGSSRSVTTHAADIYMQNKHLRAQLAGAEVLTISKYNERFLQARGFASHVVHCGVSVAPLRALKSGTAFEGDPVRILSVGRLVPKKGHDILVRAVAELAARGRNVRCKVVGEGPDLEKLQALVEQLGLNQQVTFIGALQPTQVREELAVADLFALACRRAPDGDMDGLPVVLLEAAAARVPLVTTEVGGLSEFVSRKTAFIAGESDPTSLAAAIELAIDEREARVARVAAAAALVEERFTVEQQAEGVLRAALRAGSALLR